MGNLKTKIQIDRLASVYNGRMKKNATVTRKVKQAFFNHIKGNFDSLQKNEKVRVVESDAFKWIENKNDVVFDCDYVDPEETAKERFVRLTTNPEYKKKSKPSIAMQHIIEELEEQAHPERVEDVIFWALEYYYKNKIGPTWGKTIAYSICKTIEEKELQLGESGNRKDSQAPTGHSSK